MHLFNNRLHQLCGPDNVEDWKAEIQASGFHTATEDPELSMFRNHIGREFNKKCMSFDRQDLMFTPYDAGLRPTS